MNSKVLHVVTFVAGAVLGIIAWESSSTMRGVSSSIAEAPEASIVEDAEYDVEEMPAFPGGQDAMIDYFKKNLKYPAICREQNEEGRIVVRFVVTAEGKIVNARVNKKEHPEMAEEALRLISKMPNWTPGRQGGQAVDMPIAIPVNFILK